MRSLGRSGFLTVPYTVNSKKVCDSCSQRRCRLNSDRPDKLYDVLKKRHNKNKGDYLDAMALVDPKKFIAVATGERKVSCLKIHYHL